MNAAKVDWLGFRTVGEVPAVVESVRRAYGRHGEHLRFRPLDRGYMGFEQSAALEVGGMRVGQLAYGGESQREWVSCNVSGRGCEWIEDWDVAQEALAELPRMELRRVDLALDTADGSVSHDTVVGAYRSGMFNARGRPPSMKRIEPEDPREGRTVYVGSRQQAKFFRGYEKGYELAKASPIGEVTHIDGVAVGDLYRCEVEFKPKHEPLPVDLIDRADQYFAGAYPFLAHVLSEVEPEIFVQRRERGPQLDLAGALAQIRQQYGRTLFTALVAHDGDITAVWDRIVGMHHNDALVAAGVLLVSH